MQIPILQGIYADPAGDWRTSYPRNLVPVPKATGISQGHLRPAEGLVHFADGPGVDRGGREWNGQLWRVMGSRLVLVAEDGAITDVGDVGAGGPVTMAAGFDRLAVWSGGGLYYCDGATVFRVTDVDLGSVTGGVWIAGYYASTDGASIVVTDIDDPTSINPLRYGSAEADPDGIQKLRELRNELYAIGRYSIEAFSNVGGDGFPFRRVDGALVARGAVGPHATAAYAETFAFMGGGRNEPVSVWLMGSGSSGRIATDEIDRILSRYSAAQLEAVEIESRLWLGRQHLHIHLPDQTLVYDHAATLQIGEPVWFVLTSSIRGLGQWRARHLVWCYGRWIAGDPQSSALCELTDSTMAHHGQPVGWEFGTQVLYNEGAGAIVHQIELVGLPGRVEAGADPVIWTSYSPDGEVWSQEIAVSAGKIGERAKRIVWRRCGRLDHCRMQRFRGTSDARITVSRIEMKLEPLGG